MGWLLAKLSALPRFFFADWPRGLFFVLSLPVIFTLFLGLIFSSDLVDPLLYKDKKDKDEVVPTHTTDRVMLDQGWEEGYRQKFYFSQQGSPIIPLAVALSLEGPDTEQLIFGDDGLAVKKFGFLPYPNTQGLDGHDVNPYGLPIGFIGHPNRRGEDMLEINCAACHTADINFNGQTIRVDGGSSLIDFMGFVTAIDDGIVQTLSNPAKFERFAARMGAQTPEAKSAIRVGLEVVSAERQAWQARNRTDYDHGPARVDAFGIIFNQVVARNIGMDGKDGEGNARTPIAPVSYPVLWDTPFLGRVQWSGGSNNLKLGDALGRNFGQVLGVFGDAEVTTRSSLPGFCSTVNRKNVELYHFWLKSLNSPRWEDPALENILPALDAEAVARGRDIFMGGGNGKGCVSCHGNLPNDWRERKVEDRNVCDVPMKMVAYDKVGTDRAMIETSKRQGAKTGPLAGTPSKLDGGRPLRAEEDYMTVLGEVIAGSIVGSYLSVSCDGKIGASTLIETASGLGKINKAQHKFDKKVGGGFDLEAAQKKYECEGADTYRYESYKARALNGIWASAPYLHNGSVPTLYDMLLPPTDENGNCNADECRPDQFYVGSSQFDPEKVGFDASGQTGGSVFDTSIPGNFNQGHLFGTSLTQQQKLDLIEYLKSL